MASMGNSPPCLLHNVHQQETCVPINTFIFNTYLVIVDSSLLVFSHCTIIKTLVTVQTYSVENANKNILIMLQYGTQVTQNYAYATNGRTLQHLLPDTQSLMWLKVEKEQYVVNVNSN